MNLLSSHITFGNNMFQNGTNMDESIHPTPFSVFFAVSHRIPKEQLASILRGRRDTLEACHCYCDVFSWQAWQVQHFVLLHCPLSWQAQHFVTWRRCCFVESQWQGWCQKSWQGQHFVSALKSGGSFAKIPLFESV